MYADALGFLNNIIPTGTGVEKGKISIFISQWKNLVSYIVANDSLFLRNTMQNFA